LNSTSRSGTERNIFSLVDNEVGVGRVAGTDDLVALADELDLDVKTGSSSPVSCLRGDPRYLSDDLLVGIAPILSSASMAFQILPTSISSTVPLKISVFMSARIISSVPA